MKKLLLSLSALSIFLSFSSCGSGGGSGALDFYIKDENDLQRSSYYADISNNQTYMLLERAKLNNDSLSGPYYERAMKVKHMSMELCMYIAEIKSELRSRSMNVDRRASDTLRSYLLANPGDKTTVEEYMIGKDPANVTGHAKDLKQKLRAYKTELLGLVDSAMVGDMGMLLRNLECSDIYSWNTKDEVSWEIYQFHDAPLVAALARLATIELQVKQAEGFVVSHLYGMSLVRNATHG